MKKALTFGKNDYVYWAHNSERSSHYIGTRHFMIRVQDVPDTLRKTLASIGLFEIGKTTNGQEAPSVTDIMHKNDLGYELFDTGFVTTLDKTPHRVLINSHTKTATVVNNVYFEEIVTMFGDKHVWMQGSGRFDPIHYGNYLALLLPISNAGEIERRVNLFGLLTNKPA